MYIHYVHYEVTGSGDNVQLHFRCKNINKTCYVISSHISDNDALSHLSNELHTKTATSEKHRKAFEFRHFKKEASSYHKKQKWAKN